MPELRYEPVTDTWVIIATERAKRPKDFVPLVMAAKKEGQNCPFCPGNEDQTPPEVMAYRPGGSAPDTPGWQVRVVPNKYPALDDAAADPPRRDFFLSGPAAGRHEVIIETPDHDRSLARQEPEEILLALAAWQERYRRLGQDPGIAHTQIFKNHGVVAGASLEHPHSQLIATPLVPAAVRSRLESTRAYHRERGRCYYCDTLAAEEREADRVVYADGSLLAFCPFASRFPLEVWLVPRRHAASFAEADRGELRSLAGALKAVARRLLEGMRDPPFNLMLHSLPYRETGYRDSFHWHLELAPRLTVLAGFELGAGMFINPTPPEMAAEFYRA
ncbi:MAG: galactose-1-phosphate uridylyltransferase [Clostridia bacterium]|jgi:UDPglucose--hexose-1-phosphate uridylyltransferase|nr:galactose-1-phosphate uridylyltransferase [Clostridia bacterium]MDH7573853.1 galactose-1-phosphate uridylyltransferase [Clostridia bacterium]